MGCLSDIAYDPRECVQGVLIFSQGHFTHFDDVI